MRDPEKGIRLRRIDAAMDSAVPGHSLVAIEGGAQLEDQAIDLLVAKADAVEPLGTSACDECQI